MSPQLLLTAQQFAFKAGVSTSTISKWLRNGKIQGLKKNGKWMIAGEQLARILPDMDQAVVQAKTAETAQYGVQGNYTIEEFSAMTYLTRLGVERYLKEGRLSGSRDASGLWRVDAENLQRHEIRHLIRK